MSGWRAVATTLSGVWDPEVARRVPEISFAYLQHVAREGVPARYQGEVAGLRPEAHASVRGHIRE
eukprot:1796592-Lingulodinium_polyedra.AAC.1